MSRVVSSLAALFFAVSALAQSVTTPATNQNATPVAVSDQIVVTASAVPETLQSTPAAVTVVTRKDIDDRAALDVADVLREVPGLTVSRTGSPGKATSLFTRGANSTHTLVLWNGIEINNPYFAGYDWGRFSTAGVQQVEVVRGPFSAIYGSDAVAGVVNVLTVPSKSGLRADLEAGGNGLRNGTLSGDYVSGGTQLSVTVEKRKDDGFAPNDDFDQDSQNLFWRWTSAQHFSLGAAFRHTKYDEGIPFNLNAAGTALVPSLNRRNFGNERQLAIPIQQTIGIFSYDLTLSENERSDVFTDPDDPYFTTRSATESTTRRARLTTRTNTSIGTIVLGGELERVIVDDGTNFGPNLVDQHRRDHSIFVEDRYEHAVADGGAKLELSLGIRHDDFDTFGSQTSPRVAGAVILGSSKIRAAYGEGFRAPSVGELYFPFSGNVNLRPEHSRSVELGYDYVTPGSGLFSATIFTGRYRDLINFDNATFLFGNVDRAQSDGLELGFQQSLSQNLYTAISYTYLHKDENSDTHERLARRPKNSGSIFLGWRQGSVDTNVTLLRTGQREDVLPVSPFTSTSDRGFTTVDLNVQWHYGKLIPYAKLENATNVRYDEVAGYPSPSRRAIFGLRVTL